MTKQERTALIKREKQDKAAGDVVALVNRLMTEVGDQTIKDAIAKAPTRKQRTNVLLNALKRENATGPVPQWW